MKKLIVALSFTSLAFMACNLSDDLADNNGPPDNVADVCADGRDVCSDRGDCVVEDADGESVASCECDPGYAGEFCRSCADGYVPLSDDTDECVEGTPVSCDGVECGNGTCEVDDFQTTTMCLCDEGWTGEQCDTCEPGKVELPEGSRNCIDDLCVDDPCSTVENAAPGTCVQLESDFECACGDGYAWGAGICEAQCDDPDADGFGDGPGCLGTDCLENSPSVWGPDQQTILSAEIVDATPGTPLTVASNETVTLDVEYLFTRDENCPTCLTKIFAAYYSPDSHYIASANCVVAESAPLACTAGGTAGAVSVEVPVPNHDGDYELRLFTTSDDEPRCDVAARALMSTADPALGETVGSISVGHDMCYQPGQVWTKISNLEINGMATNRYEAQPGEEIRLKADYAHSQGGCTGCVLPLAVGLMEERVGCFYSGVPEQCTLASNWTTTGTADTMFDYVYDADGNATLVADKAFTAPMDPGVYQLRYSASQVFRCDVNNFVSLSRAFNTFAVIVVP